MRTINCALIATMQTHFELVYSQIEESYIFERETQK